MLKALKDKRDKQGREILTEVLKNLDLDLHIFTYRAHALDRQRVWIEMLKKGVRVSTIARVTGYSISTVECSVKEFRNATCKVSRSNDKSGSDRPDQPSRRRRRASNDFTSPS